MIALQRLNGTMFWLNPELIEQVDKTPDTVITLVTGNNIIVLESVEAVVERILEYRRAVQPDGEKKPTPPLPATLMRRT